MKVSQKIFDLCALLEDKKATDITVCNTSILKKPVDFFVLATATSVTHVKGIADYLIENIQKSNMFEMCEREGLVTSDWVVVDLGEGFVHIFIKEIREKYNLEKLVNEGNNIRNFEKIKKDFEKDKKNEEKSLRKKATKEKPIKEKPQKNKAVKEKQNKEKKLKENTKNKKTKEIKSKELKAKKDKKSK